jgi:hypothetical protein
MKRFMLFIAMVGFVATSCSKTIVKDEVETAISFSTESSKLTRAIVQNNPDPNDPSIVNRGVYFTNQPFGVFAYGSEDNGTPFMDNVEISYTDSKWKATITNQVSTKYYWPNDPETTVNFYAYSPACSTANATTPLASHQMLNCTRLAHSETSLNVTGYTHNEDQMYVDFMVATPVKGATYVNPDGSNDNDVDGVVPMVFNHKMTQILFNVTTNQVYPGVTFTIKSITLKNVRNNADYVHTYANASDTWTVDPDSKTSYKIFPADDNKGANATNPVDNASKKENVISLTYAPDAADDAFQSMTTTGVTMIPQTMAECSKEYVAGADAIAYDTNGQMFEIVYSISGTGVATETVTKHIPFHPHSNDLQGQNVTIVNWGVNKRITYKVKIGLNEVTFEPSVADWKEDDPAGNTYTFVQ